MFTVHLKSRNLRIRLLNCKWRPNKCFQFFEKFIKTEIHLLRFNLLGSLLGFHDRTVQQNWKGLLVRFLGNTGKLNLNMWFLHLVALGR